MSYKRETSIGGKSYELTHISEAAIGSTWADVLATFSEAAGKVDMAEYDEGLRVVLDVAQNGEHQRVELVGVKTL
jgi:hypothetical protein